MNVPMLLEATMLLCFGLAWPIATARMLRTGRAEGKGLPFTLIIWVGYLAGAASKIVTQEAPDVPLAPVFWLYVLNSFTVGLNGWLQWYLPQRSKPRNRSTVPRRQGAGRLAPVAAR
jgi:hypothetical protein